MPSIYLKPDEYAMYGLPSSTTESQIIQASTLINGYLQRAEGLIWVPDAVGNPCYMEASVPMITLTATTGFSPGQNVNVTVTGGVQAVSLGSSQCGLVAILDRNDPSKREAVIVQSINNSSNLVQLQNVQFAHDAGTLLEFGLVIFEELNMPAGRPITSVSKTPVVMVLAGQGRYGYTRRGTSSYLVDQFDLLAAITTFGGPPIWEIFNQNLVGVNPNGELWAPAGILMAYYTQIRFSYIAGWRYENLPPNIKTACANLVLAARTMPMNGAISSYRAGDTAIQRFGATYFSDDIKDSLEPFMARQYI